MLKWDMLVENHKFPIHNYWVSLEAFEISYIFCKHVFTISNISPPIYSVYIYKTH